MEENNNYFIWTVPDNDASPDFVKGDQLLCEPLDNDSWDSPIWGIYKFIKTGQSLLRKSILRSGCGLYLVGLSNRITPIKFDPNDGNIEKARVIEKIRNLTFSIPIETIAGVQREIKQLGSPMGRDIDVMEVKGQIDALLTSAWGQDAIKNLVVAYLRGDRVGYEERFKNRR